MKKIFLVLLFGLFLIQPIFAESRQGSTIKAYTTSTLIKTGDWKVYKITMIATASGGNFAIYNSLINDSTVVQTEGSEATSLNSKVYDFTSKPLEGSTGLYLAVTTANVIVEYE